MALSYWGYRKHFQDISGSLNVGAATDDTTLVTVRDADHTIYIQVIHVQFTNSNAATWSFEDSAGSPIQVAATAAAVAGTHSDYDFGPVGIPLTAGKNFVLNVSATGASGRVTWEGYHRIATVTPVGSTN